MRASGGGGDERVVAGGRAVKVLAGTEELSSGSDVPAAMIHELGVDAVKSLLLPHRVHLHRVSESERACASQGCETERAFERVRVCVWVEWGFILSAALARADED